MKEKVNNLVLFDQVRCWERCWTGGSLSGETAPPRRQIACAQQQRLCGGGGGSRQQRAAGSWWQKRRRSRSSRPAVPGLVDHHKVGLDQFRLGSRSLSAECVDGGGGQRRPRLQAPRCLKRGIWPGPDAILSFLPPPYRPPSSNRTQATYDKLLSEVPKYKMISTSILCDRLRVSD